MGAPSKFLDTKKVALRSPSRGSFWSRLSFLVLLLLLISGSAVILLMFVPQMTSFQNYEKERETIQLKIDHAKQRRERLKNEHDFLKFNHRRIEREIRDVLNMGYAGEIIFRFDAYQPEPTPNSK